MERKKTRIVVSLVEVLLCAVIAKGDTMSERCARIRAVADAVCTITNVAYCDGRTTDSGPNPLAQWAAADVPEIKGTSGRIRIDFVLKPEAGSDIRCKAEFAMPEKWDGRMWGHGNSGYAGAMLRISQFANWGSAAVTTDLGTWAYTDNGTTNRKVWPDCVRRDYDWRATHLMTVYGKRLVEAFYGRPPRMCYFVGGSCGGRQAFSEAIRFPADYDGIIANLPGNNSICKDVDIVALWKQAHDAAGNPLFTTNDMRIVSDAAVRYMADRDERPYAGKILSNPFLSERDIDGFLRVAARMEPRLGEPDLQRRLRNIYLGCTHKGKRVTHGETPGAYLGKQMNWKGLIYFPQFLIRKGLGMKDVTWEDVEEFVRDYAAGYNACSDDLDAFRDRGGKLMVTVGLEDQTVSPAPQIAHFERVVRRHGGDLERVQSFYRLFAIPGCAHGGGKGRAMTCPPCGPDQWKQIVDWRERGCAPERFITYWKPEKFKMPVAVYPKRLVMDGDGKWVEREFDRTAIRETDPFYLQCETKPQ